MSGPSMDTWASAARADLARRQPDPMVETQLLARVRERRALQSVAAARPAPVVRARRDGWARLSFGLPVAFAAMLMVLLGTRLTEPVAVPPPGRAGGVGTPFIALVGTEALAGEPAPVVVASQVTRGALADYGLPVDPARPDEPVDAEFLVSRSGTVLAVRFKE